MAYGTSYYAISLGINILLTALIIGRLLVYRRTHLAHLPAGHAHQYLSLAALVVAALIAHAGLRLLRDERTVAGAMPSARRAARSDATTRA